VTTGAECLNCGAALAGPYCSACGQKGDVRIPSLGHVVADALGDLVNFDSRIWRSLVALTLKPGRLTRCYLEGQRQGYTPPFRMYLVTSLVFFLIVSLARFAPSTAPLTAEQLDADINARVDAALNDAGVPRPAQPPVPAEVAEPGPTDEAAQPGFGITRDDDGEWACQMDEDLDPRTRARLEAACRKIEADSGASFARAFADNVPLMMLLFIPIVAAIMKVLYLFARRKYVEHLLFFLHVHTFFFLTAIIVVLVGRAANLVSWLYWPSMVVGIAAWIYFPIYVYRAMRHVYAQGHALTAVKYVVLGVGYFVAFLLTLLGLIVYTALTL
jgi:hypothetical protein